MKLEENPENGTIRGTVRVNGADDKGEYEIKGLPLGDDYRVAVRTDWETHPVEKPDNAVGDEVNFILEVGSGHALEGVVRDRDGHPVSDVRLEAWSGDLAIRGKLGRPMEQPAPHRKRADRRVGGRSRILLRRGVRRNGPAFRR